MLTLKQNIESVIEHYFYPVKNEIKSAALNRILEVIDNEKSTEKIRVIHIVVNTDSNDPLSFIEDDIAQELLCCSTDFDIDTMKVSEVIIENGTEVICRRRDSME